MHNFNSKPTVIRVNQIYFNIYHYLYLAAKSKSINNVNQQILTKKPTYSFKLPDTILFVDDIPKIWLFTNKNNEIKKKYTAKLDINKIIEYFESKGVNYGKDKVIASYMYCSEDNKDIKFEDPFENQKFINERKVQDYITNKGFGIYKPPVIEDNFTLIHEFFEANQLKSFLLNTNKRQGVLQLFVESQQDPNSSYKLTWSPNYLTAQIKSSRQTKNRQGIHFYEKVVTYENDEYCTNTELVKSQIAINKLNNICVEIVTAIEELFENSIKIKNIILYMKQGTNFEINLMFCSSIGFIEYEDKDHQVFVYKGKLFNNRLSDAFRFNPHKVVYYKKNSDKYEKHACVSCGKVYLKENFHHIDVRSIIKWYQYNRSKPILKNYNNSIPEIIKQIEIIQLMLPKSNKVQGIEEQRLINELTRVKNSNIPGALVNEFNVKTNSEYKEMIKNKLFLKRELEVCEICFFEFIDIKDLTNEDFKAKIFQGNIKKSILERKSKLNIDLKKNYIQKEVLDFDLDNLFINNSKPFKTETHTPHILSARSKSKNKLRLNTAINKPPPKLKVIDDILLNNTNLNINSNITTPSHFNTINNTNMTNKSRPLSSLFNASNKSKVKLNHIESSNYICTEFSNNPIYLKTTSNASFLNNNELSVKNNAVKTRVINYNLSKERLNSSKYSKYSSKFSNSRPFSSTRPITTKTTESNNLKLN